MIKKFYEAIIDWETENIKGFYKDSLDIIKDKRIISFDEFVKIGNKYDIEIVDYHTFISELPEKMKEDAPAPQPIFGLVNPVTHKIRIVVLFKQIDSRMLDAIYGIIKHENIHIGQLSRKKDKSKSEFYGDVRDLKSYFSNKDEIMAFSQTIVDMIMNGNPKSLEEAKSKLKYNKLWHDIKLNVDNLIKKRYLKYIYLYLEKEFEKINIQRKDIEENDITKKVNNLLKKSKDGVLRYDVYDKIIDKIIDEMESIEDESKRIEIAKKIKEINNIMSKGRKGLTFPTFF